MMPKSFPMCLHKFIYLLSWVIIAPFLHRHLADVFFFFYLCVLVFKGHNCALKLLPLVSEVSYHFKVFLHLYCKMLIQIFCLFFHWHYSLSYRYPAFTNSSCIIFVSHIFSLNFALFWNFLNNGHNFINFLNNGQ